MIDNLLADSQLTISLIKFYCFELICKFGVQVCSEETISEIVQRYLALYPRVCCCGVQVCCRGVQVSCGFQVCCCGVQVYCCGVEGVLLWCAVISKYRNCPLPVWVSTGVLQTVHERCCCGVQVLLWCAGMLLWCPGKLLWLSGVLGGDDQ